MKYKDIMPKVITVEYDKTCKKTIIRDGKGNVDNNNNKEASKKFEDEIKVAFENF